jgi:enterochelin esterase family protein
MRELILHPPFNRFLARELVPWIRECYNVTHDPGHTIVGGCSAGGLAAAYAGFEHPEIFGNALAQSGAFSFAPRGDPEHEWLARQFAASERLPLRFHIDAGVLEVNSLRDIGDAPSLVVASRHMRTVLRAKGYEVHYAEVGGGHDYISWQGTLADGLQALVGTHISRPG